MFSHATTSYSQIFNFNKKSASIKEVCKEIEENSSYIFVFSDSSEKIIDKKVNIDANTSDVKEVLDAVLSNSGLTYMILDKQIVIYESKENLSSKDYVEEMSSSIKQQQGKRISGRILDAFGESIIGANVVEVGTTNGTVTDIDGNFSLDVAENASIQITYIGYIEQIINTTGRVNFNIILQEDTKALDEVIVIGYGTRQRSSITGAVDQVSSDLFEDRPVSNAVQALQGASANLIVQQKNMNPNDNNMSINIRGVSTMGNNDPLCEQSRIILLLKTGESYTMG
jgi:hypothetical protein